MPTPRPRTKIPAETSPVSTVPTSVVRLRVTYVEVDRMGYMHHSNHLRWFERGREEFCRRRSIAYREMEDSGTLVVVVDARLDYVSPLKLEDLADLTVRLAEIRPASLIFEYELRRVSDGALVATGRTRHAFVTRNGRLVRPSPQIVGLLGSEESVHRLGEVE